MLSKRAAITFFATLIGLAAAFLAALYLYDPLSIFHMPYGRELRIGKNMRQQNIAMIRHLPFDSLIMGNSYTENTSAREAGEQLGGRFINLSMSGSNLYERSLVLDYILSRQKIKTVFSLLTESAAREGHGSYPVSEWAFLYDDSRLNDFKVYLNSLYLGCLAKWSDSPRCTGRQVDLDRPSAWFQFPANSSLFGGLDNWILHHEDVQVSTLLHETLAQYAGKTPLRQEKDIAPEEAAAIRAAIDEFIVRPAREYPATSFIYFFNPVPLLARAIAAREGDLSLYAFWVREATFRCAALDNIGLYAFDNEAFTGDIKYYKDLGHYSPDINSLILQAVSQDKNRLRPDNVDQHLKLLFERAAAYDIEALEVYVRERLGR